MAVAPAIFFMYFFWVRDRYEPEPRNKIALVMVLGGLSVIPAVILEMLGDRVVTIADEGAPPFMALFMHTFVVIAMAEELGKFLVVRFTLYRDPEFDEPYDGIVYCVAASLGFALVENVLYVMTGGAGVAVLRAVLSVPAHALFGVAMGYFMGQARFANTRSVEIQLQLIGFFSAVAMHGAYDFVLFSQRPLIMLSVLPLMAVFWFIGLRLVKYHVEVSPHKPPRTSPPAGPLPIGSDVVGTRCQFCQRPLHPGAIFCGHCGGKVNPI